jgi:hypothetical protein
VLLLVYFTLVISVLSLLVETIKGSSPNITSQLRNFGESILVVDYKSTF